MKRQPVLGRFGLGLSYGLPAGVAVVALLAVISDRPAIGSLSWIGIGIALAVAVFVTTRDEAKPNR